MSNPPSARKQKPTLPWPVLALAFGGLALLGLLTWWAFAPAEAPAPASEATAPTRRPGLRVATMPTEEAAATDAGTAPLTPEEEAAVADSTNPGIAGLPPAHLKPILRGLVVPDGFVLPKGYVRHYQPNEDGTMLEPILTFHPDYQPTDAVGRPIPVGPDRIVPPELAPPGFPLKRLEVPSPDFTDGHEDAGP